MRGFRDHRAVQLAGVLAIAAASACASPPAGGTPPSGAADPHVGPPAPRVPGRTEVIMLGTLHGAHLNSQGYPLSLIRRVVCAVKPDVVLVEVPPDRFESGVKQVAALPSDHDQAQVEDSWLRAFPEITRVAIPLRQRLGYELVPVSGWRPKVSRDRKAYQKEHPGGPDDAAYQQAQAAFEKRVKERAAAESPLWLNGPEYLRVSGAARRALSRAADGELGAAAVMAINGAHFAKIRAAVEAHRGRRLLLIYGARHRWYQRPRLKAMKGVTLLDVRPFIVQAQDTDLCPR